MYRKWRQGNRCPLECWEMMQQRNVFGKGTPITQGGQMVRDYYCGLKDLGGSLYGERRFPYNPTTQDDKTQRYYLAASTSTREESVAKIS